MTHFQPFRRRLTPNRHARPLGRAQRAALADPANSIHHAPSVIASLRRRGFVLVVGGLPVLSNDGRLAATLLGVPDGR